MQLDECPHCGANLIGDPIPQEYRDEGHYGNATHWRRELGVEIQGVYDGILFWRCPDCGRAWNRWAPGDDRLYRVAQRYVDDVNARMDL